MAAERHRPATTVTMITMISRRSLQCRRAESKLGRAASKAQCRSFAREVELQPRMPADMAAEWRRSCIPCSWPRRVVSRRVRFEDKPSFRSLDAPTVRKSRMQRRWTLCDRGISDSSTLSRNALLWHDTCDVST